MLFLGRINLADFNVRIMLIITAVMICLSKVSRDINHEYSDIGVYIYEIMLMIYITKVSVKSKPYSTV